MSAGLFALLDDIAAFAKLAAASADDVASAAGRTAVKTAGVVVDDTAVTPQYVHGIAAERELPVIKRIAYGSARNKLLVILPVIMVLSQVAPWAVTPILMLGATYLSFEGAEKVWHALTGHYEHGDVSDGTAGVEDRTVKAAVRTDLILSTEIMVISLNEVMHYSFPMRLAVLVVVALLMTVAVYGVVGMIVRMDDLGLRMVQREGSVARFIGRGLLSAMPKVLSSLTVIGTVAMLWVGGHIFVEGMHTLRWGVVHELFHHAADYVSAYVGSAGAWITGTALSAVFGLLWGTLVFKAIDLVTALWGAGSRMSRYRLAVAVLEAVQCTQHLPYSACLSRSGQRLDGWIIAVKVHVHGGRFQRSGFPH